jgi:hypothetical protein
MGGFSPPDLLNRKQKGGKNRVYNAEYLKAICHMRYGIMK